MNLSQVDKRTSLKSCKHLLANLAKVFLLSSFMVHIISRSLHRKQVTEFVKN